jgi:hypothetical protein
LQTSKEKRGEEEDNLSFYNFDSLRRTSSTLILNYTHKPKKTRREKKNKTVLAQSTNGRNKKSVWLEK